MVRRALTSVLPVLVCAGAAGWALHDTQVGVRDIVVFALVQLVFHTVPGTLAWRGLRGRSSSLLHDLTIGTAVGHALVLACYLVGRAVGLPLAAGIPAVLLPPVFLAVPALRRHWRADPDAAHGPAYTWTVTACIVFLCFWFAERTVLSPVAGRSAFWQQSDYLFLQSIAADARHHVPPTVPYVVGEPLHYHWFGLADAAATSWLGHLEVGVLVLRLMPLGCLVVGFLAFAVLAEHVARRPAVGATALVLATAVGSVSLVGGPGAYVVDGTLLMVGWSSSPTQGYAQVAAAAMLVPLIDILRGRGTRGSWGAFVGLSLLIMGSKATFVPVVGAGVALAAVVDVVRRRTLRTPAVAAGCVLTAELVFAQVVLFGGATQGVRVAPGEGLRLVGGFLRVRAAEDTLPLLAVGSLVVLGWLVPLLPSLLLLRRPHAGGPVAGTREDPAVLLIAGMVAAGAAATCLLTQPGFSEYFFLRAGLPFGYVLVAWSVVVVSDRLGVRRTVAMAAVGAIAGLVVVGACRRLADDPRPGSVSPGQGLAFASAAVLVLAAAAVVGARRRGGSPLLALVAAGAVALGMGGARTVSLIDAPSTNGTVAGVRADRPLPFGAFAAGRYVRAHSRPDDYVATNAHCQFAGGGTCDARAFWIPAAAERRTVVQGWAYTDSANRGRTTMLEVALAPFWDPALLRANDAVFRTPSRAAVRRLQRRWPVRWLIVDRRFPADVARLRALFTAHRFGEVWVFEVPPATH